VRLWTNLALVNSDWYSAVADKPVSLHFPGSPPSDAKEWLAHRSRVPICLLSFLPDDVSFITLYHPFYPLPHPSAAAPYTVTLGALMARNARSGQQSLRECVKPGLEGMHLITMREFVGMFQRIHIWLAVEHLPITCDGKGVFIDAA
jgi:hypothetical protein